MMDIDPRFFVEGGPLGLVGMVLVWFLYRIEGKLERFTRANEDLAKAVTEVVEEDKLRRRFPAAGGD
ncbi:MAG: hypothetical protein QF898_06095 [SAR202 cluster bacterium]|jgi:hypothetical protein|nr:hypothetical protein [SAR202 cluster bacterium]